jgi:hypothetical protein
MPEPNRADSFCRVVRLRNNPRRVDEGIKLWTKEILPLHKKQKGFGGPRSPETGGAATD